MKPVTKSDIKSEVLDKINAGEIRMKPKIYFLFIWLFSILGIVSSTILSAYLVSITIFWLRIHTANTMAYGARANLDASLSTFPWLTGIVGILSVLCTYLLVRRHGTMYRYPVTTIIGTILSLSLLLGLLFSFVSVNGSFPLRVLHQYNGSP